MRVLTLSNCPLQADQGSGYVILNYAEGLRERGHQVTLLGPEQFEWPRRGTTAGRYRQMIGMARCALQRASRGYDIFEFWGGEAWLAISLLRRRRRRPLLVAHSNGLEPLASRSLRRAPGVHSRWYQFDLSALYAKAFRGADGLVTVSDFDRSFALAEGYQPLERVVSLENPLPDELLGQPQPRDRSRKVVFCGSWIPRKGIELLGRDCTEFLNTHPEWGLVLVGVGEAQAPISWFPESLRHRIEVIPRADRIRELPAIFRRCAIAIQPSIYESFGLAAAEAMAAGCALVSTPVGFAASLRHEEDALLLPQGDSPHLFRALDRLARDTALRIHLARHGHQRVQTLRWPAACDRLDALYRAWSSQRKRVESTR